MSGALAVTVVVAVVLATLPALLLWVLDRRAGGGEWVAAVVAMLWSGAAGAAGAAVVVNTVTLPDGVDPVLVAALVAALPLLLVAVGRVGYDCPADAMAVTLATAGGWMVGWSGGRSAALTSDPAAALAVLREALAWMVIWTLAGIVVGLSSLLARRWARVLLAAAAVVVGLAAQRGWVAVRTQLPPASAGGAVVAVLAAAVVAALAVALVLWLERRRLTGELREEVLLGVLPPWAEEIFPWYWRRVRGGWWPHRAERTVVSRLVSRLAFRKQALRQRGAEVGDLAWLEVVQLRSRLCRMIAPLGDDDDQAEARRRPSPADTATATAADA